MQKHTLTYPDGTPFDCPEFDPAGAGPALPPAALARAGQELIGRTGRRLEYHQASDTLIRWLDRARFVAELERRLVAAGRRRWSDLEGEIEANLKRVAPRFSIRARARVISPGMSPGDSVEDWDRRRRAFRRERLPEKCGRRCLAELNASWTRAKYAVLSEGCAIAFREGPVGYERIPPEEWGEAPRRAWTEARWFVFAGELPECFRGEDYMGAGAARSADPAGAGRAFLQELRERSRAAWPDRVPGADPLAPVYRFKGPWRLDVLGPALAGRPELGAVRSATLEAGGPKNVLSSGERIKWIDDRADLTGWYLSGIRDQVGQSFLDFVLATEDLWRIECVLEWGDSWAVLLDHLHLDRKQEQIDRDMFGGGEGRAGFEAAREYARRFVEDALERGWRELFTSGQALVYEHDGNRLDLWHPEEWSEAPPFALPEWQWFGRMNWTGAEPGFYFDMTDPLHLLRGGGCEDDERRFRFLRSADLSPLEASVPEEQGASGALSRSPSPERKRGRPKGAGSLRDADAPLVEEAIALLERGEASSATAAATMVHNNDPDRVKGGGSPDSRIKRLARQIAKAWERK